MKELKKYTKEYQPYIISVAIVLAIILIAVSLEGKKSDKLKEGMEDFLEENSEVIGVDTSKTSNPRSKSPQTVVTNNKLAYGEAWKIYGDRRIQFSETCYATPAHSTYKNGTEIMLDNRSPESKTFRLGNIAHVIAGYDYKIVKLSYDTFPTEVLIDCGAQQNVATIIVQQ
jgi:hypothetical protein